MNHLVSSKRKGFTLIELLVVISIIGFLTTLAVVSLNTARTKSRDGKRLSDMKQLHTAMELCLTNQGSANEGKYTGCCTRTVAAPAPQRVSTCGGTLSTYIQGLVNFKDPSGNTTACTASPAGVCDYAFTTLPAEASPVDMSYTVTFWQEGGDGAGNVGPAGITR